MPTNFIYKQCTCGQKFASEGEMSRHQKTCRVFRSAKADVEFVEPLRKEVQRLNVEADGIYTGIAQAFQAFALEDMREAKYKLQVARNQHEHVIPYLTALVDQAAEVAKNRDAIVDRLQSQLKDLTWRFSDLESVLQATTKLLSKRSG